MRYFIFLSIILFLVACSSSSEENKKSVKTALSGEQVYATYCVACHGADGAMGFSGATNLRNSNLTLEERINIIAKGRKAMNAFKGILSAEEIENVSVYIETLRD